MTAYYNEFDPHAAAWLRELIKAGHIPVGDVDERSIEDVRPDDLRGYHQHHFFAGIGGWAYALRLAGWPDDKRVWTGSCPCQPFSAAGKGTGFEDERHLWPAWQHLIAQCRPAVVFGEQVASKRADAWIDLVHADMEGMGYAFGCVAFAAAGVGAEHPRERSIWVADSDGWNPGAERKQRGREHGQQPKDGGSDFWSRRVWRMCADGKARAVEPESLPLAHGLPARVVRLRGYGNAIVPQQAAEFVKAFCEARGVMDLAEAA